MLCLKKKEEKVIYNVDIEDIVADHLKNCCRLKRKILKTLLPVEKKEKKKKRKKSEPSS